MIRVYFSCFEEVTRLHIDTTILNHFHGWTFYRLTSTLLATQHRRSESRMVIFFLIKRTVWDRYLQVVIVKLDVINVATPFDVYLFYQYGAVASGGGERVRGGITS